VRASLGRSLPGERERQFVALAPQRVIRPRQMRVQLFEPRDVSAAARTEAATLEGGLRASFR